MERRLLELSVENFRSLGRARRITIHGQKVSVVDTRADAGKQEIGINALSSGLSTLPRLSDDRGGTEVTTAARQLASFRVFDVAVHAARQLSRFARRSFEALDDDAANRDTGTQRDPKKILMQKVRGASRGYRESAAPDVLAQAVGLRCVERPEDTTRSWQQLHADAVACCRVHLSSPGRAR